MQLPLPPTLQVGPEGHAICALSGGVDSSVAATLVHKVLGDRLHCVFVDNGLLRLKVGSMGGWGYCARVLAPRPLPISSIHLSTVLASLCAANVLLCTARVHL